MSITYYEIPLAATPQLFTLSLNGIAYRFQFIWRDGCFANWFFDVSTANNSPVLHGVPLIEGADLLAQYGYLNFGVQLYCVFSEQKVEFAGLGSVQRLYVGVENG
ncbi:phage baseplate plug family protein [Entomobacter blattae]|uniref:Cyanophage baseplate Pam3 plug gp18 domain-containing protein n=1 Tax=Entomobacter blattae TaxID=2762277 RepID=A0A7H1NTS8_9PROT|nr:hypothetical protein [Entomobacter blattae]QNT79188.1 hypothetical protein JGUZn3_19830 [Entomobacter blattae]